MKNCFKVVGGFALAGAAIYTAGVFIPAVAMNAASAGAAVGIKSGFATIPLIGGTIANSSLVTTVTGQVGTVAAGEAYAAMKATTCLGLGWGKAAAVGSMGYAAGSTAVDYTITGATSIFGAIKNVFNKKPSTENVDIKNLEMKEDDNGFVVVSTVPSKNEQGCQTTQSLVESSSSNSSQVSSSWVSNLSGSNLQKVQEQYL